MSETSVPPVSSQNADPGGLDPDPAVEEELLVEEISIDGMCGVY